MTDRPLKLALVAGEVSGDLLGADLVRALRQRHGAVELVGVGGEEMEAQGLVSLFDYAELSIMGLSQVLARLPNLVRRISQTANAIIAARPDVLVIIDSPDFTHRVARKVRAGLPDLPIVDYVCPSVWAWKPERAQRMRPYVDHVLAVLPFEPEVMARLGGPPTTYVGHRLVVDPNVRAVRAAQAARAASGLGRPATCLVLPGSRSSETSRLLPPFREAVEELAQRQPGTRFLLPTVPRQAKRVKAAIADWRVKPEVTVGATAKWAAFAEADAAIAASGTVILELALCGIPAVSTYKADFLIRMMHKRIRIWSANLPSLIADYPVVPEYFNESVRPGALARWLERLSADTAERRTMLEGYQRVWEIMSTDISPGEKAAEIVLGCCARKGGQPA